MTHALRMIVLLLLVGAAPGLAWGLSIGQKDTFQDGTTNGWSLSLLDLSNPFPPANLPTGGPGGAGDAFLLITAVEGSGSVGRLSAINIRQWTGDFIAAGITSIRMDLNNLGADNLSLRLLLSDTVGASTPTNAAFSTLPLLLPAHSGWTNAVFPITPEHLTPSVGTAAAALHATAELQLYHAVGAGLPEEGVTGSLGVDNITATPEPSSMVLLGSGLLALYSLKTWRGRKLLA